MSEVYFKSIFSFFYRTNHVFENFCTDTHEIVYMLNGEGYTQINKNTYECVPNSICFTRAGDTRSHSCIKKTDYICVRFTGDIDTSLLTGVYKCSNNKIRDALLEIQTEFENKRYKYFDVCNLKINEILIRLSRLTSVDSGDPNIYNLIKKIDSDKLYNLSVEEMAKSVAYSYDYFRRKFKEVTGQSPIEYLINKRVDNACKLLCEGEFSCTEIAQLCGFSSSAQFSSIFKRKVGVSPKRYTKNTKT